MTGTGMGAAMLTACGDGIGTGGGQGSGGFSQPDGDTPAEYAGRQRIVLWSTFGEAKGALVDELATQFNESQEDIYVEVQFQGSYGDNLKKLTAAILAQQVPDLAVLSGGWRSLYLSGALAPLDDYYGDDFALEDYNEGLLAEGQVDGTTYWVPFARSTPLFYYNKDLFAAAGLPDRAPETWSELREWAPTFMSESEEAKLYGVSMQDSDWQFRGMLWNFGASVADGFAPTLTTPEAIATGEYTRALIHDDGAASTPSNIVADFQNGLVAAASMSTAALGNLFGLVDFEIGAAFMPGELERAVPTGGGGLSIPAGVPEERREAAVKFLKFLAAPPQAARWSVETGYILASSAAAEEEVYQDRLAESPLFGLAAEQLQYVRAGDPLRAWVPQVGSALFGTLQEIWGDGADPAELFEPLNEELQSMSDEFLLEHGDTFG
ncbi:ABC transporter substrate-binding protein [Ruania zhangjianzhongii]|uniref:ABC transporter substrate-binding protein n=1 Tax=Ruania zhangjianzhongii TaxID=2603206 RepID=UPI00143D1462|nr:ABC transporter substrate-binding protein [Ruania zhangjianzhongii]